jgi:hypothetical protein
VPDERYEEAAALAEELASAELVEEGGERRVGDDVEDDVGEDLPSEETSR